MEFHDDLFPDTASDEPSVSATAWFTGANGQVMAEHKVLLLPWLHSINLKLETNEMKINLTITSEYLTFGTVGFFCAEKISKFKSTKKDCHGK